MDSGEKLLKSKKIVNVLRKIIVVELKINKKIVDLKDRIVIIASLTSKASL
jgi:hypothetical protein